ncbi:hypothetical protein SISNIDRAFT_548650 [Sistotremastrum niveocremeum HHB9708]|uniref:CAAX prenyl protease n=2 Tax=Sistotremastraceae TaxID=3402574 RepID=A0A164WSF5_9AGAM|nr:hypothetical protein SISNIDRAFT_548650 [Sistotremastrum niveocremeum HHB9708]KZT38396.1 metalloendopeptidase [Sistotremastrum suecicum HHB10207 ss-3]
MEVVRLPLTFFQTQVQYLRQRFSWVATTPVNYKLYVVGASWAIWGFESYLQWRQYPHLSKKEVPQILADSLDQETFEKSQAYGRAKAKFGFWSGLYSRVLDTGILYYGMWAWSWGVADSVVQYYAPGTSHEIWQTLITCGIQMVFGIITDLPVSVYHTFWLEAAHGFNKTTPTVFVTDLIKGFFVQIAIGVPFLAAFTKLLRWAGDSFVPAVMSFLVAFIVVMQIIYPVLIQPLFNKLSPLAEGELRSRIEKLASGLNYPLKKLYEIDGSKRSSHSNAYMYGLPWSKHIVIYDTLIEQSKPDEVEAVVAHELGHWYYNHPMKLMLVSQLHIFAILTASSVFLHAPPLLKAFDFPDSVAQNPPMQLSFFLFQLLLTPAEAVISFGMNAISRYYEWQADEFAAQLPSRLKSKGFDEKDDMGERLGRALKTLHIKNLSTVWVDWLYSAYHNSHPTLMERLKALKGFETDSHAKSRKEL